MAHHRSRRHRAEDMPPAYDAYEPYDAYDGYNPDPYAAYAPRRGSSAAPAPPPARSPPRRHKSEKRRDPSPNYYSDAPYGSSRSHGHRHRSSRHHDRSEPAEAPLRGRSTGPDPRNAYPSPSPDVDVKPHRSHRSKRDRHRQTEPDGYEQYHQDSYARDPYARDPYARDPYAHDPYSRSRYPPDPRDDRQDSHRRHSQPSDGHRRRGRSSRHAESDEDNYYGAVASRGRGDRHRGFDERSPSRGRRGGSRDRGRGDRGRRQSMPATTKAKTKAKATANAKIPWWQNPYIQAGARTAITAGAQAAMQSKSDKSAWLGPKGAKVATAALGAALVDGFMGQKYPGSTRQKIAKEGVDIAAGKAAEGAGMYRRRHH